MATYERVVVTPDSVRTMSVLATICTVLLGIGWLFAALLSMTIASSRIANPHPFEDMTPLFTAPLALALWVGFMVSGLFWAMWQRKVALVAAAGEGVRDPMWHAQAWFAPVVMWWEPLRNVRELARHFLAPSRRRLVTAWWALWAAFRIMCWLVFWQLFAPGSLVLLPTLVTVAAAIVTVAATALAVVLIQLLTTAALNRVREPAMVTYAAKPFPSPCRSSSSASSSASRLLSS